MIVIYQSETNTLYRCSTIQYQNNQPTSSHRRRLNDTVSKQIYQQKLSHLSKFLFVQTEKLKLKLSIRPARVLLLYVSATRAQGGEGAKNSVFLQLSQKLIKFLSHAMYAYLCISAFTTDPKIKT